MNKSMKLYKRQLRFMLTHLQTQWRLVGSFSQVLLILGILFCFYAGYNIYNGLQMAREGQYHVFKLESYQHVLES